MSHPTPEALETGAQALLKDLAGKALKPKERMAIPAQEMPHQPADVRSRNFEEVALGYGPAQAKAEAMRCLQCKNAPCVEGCPVRIDIPGFVKAIAEGDDARTITVIKQASLLPAVCGRVCPQDRKSVV